MKRFWFHLGTVGGFLLGTASLQAEIQTIVFKWNAALCLETCIPRLERNIQEIHGVESISINAQAGIATLSWNPNIPFSFAPFNTQTRATGIRLSDIRLRVKGTIVPSGNDFYLVSLGDNTRFRLIGTVVAQPDSYIIQANVASRPLSPALQEQFLQAAQNQQLVTVEGPLFEPFRYTLVLVTEQISFAKKPESPPGAYESRRMR